MEFDYQQALLEAMNIVAGARINDLPFDRTIVCSIEDASQAAQGHYRVSDGSTTFDAWTDDTHYNVGQRVYVQIPGNNMASQKHIIGRYFEAENEMLIYVSPEEKEAVVKNIIWEQLNQVITITGNSVETKLEELNIESNTLDLYNGLRLDVDITCPLGEYTILSGNYGVKIECYYQDVISPVLLYFDSQEDIFGNPYDIEVPTSFTQTYFVPSYLDQGDGAKPLKYIVPYVYQKGNFLYRDNAGEAQILDRGTITFNSIVISQICDVSIYEDDTALLITSDGLEYTPQRVEENWNGLNKTLNLTFIHKTKDNKSIGFTDGEFTNLALDTAYWQDLEASIKALQLDVYEVQATAVINNGLVEESYQSKLTNLEEWRQEVLDNLETKITQLQAESNKITYAIVWKRNELDGTWKTYEEAYSDESLQAECLPTAQTTEFVVEVWRSGNKVASNSITFTNTLDVFGTDVGRKNIDVFLTHGEKSQKTYPFYDAQGHIIQQNNMSIERTLQWGYKASSGYAGTIENPQEFFKGWKIEWHIPKTATSLRPPQNHKWTSLNNEYIYSVTIENDIAESYLKYTIAEWHIISNVNNTIRCIITDPLGNVYPKEGELKEDFIFSTFGNSGTDYSLVISEKNNKPAYTGDDKDYELQAKLYDKDGKDITPEEGIEIKPKDFSVNSTNYSVVTAEAAVDWQGKNVKAKAIYPIAWRAEAQYIYNGPIYIYYDSNNTNPTYNQVLELIFTSNRIVDWELQSNDTSDTRQHYNFQIETNEKAVLLKVPSMYTSELKNAQICIVARIDNKIVYKQPLIITQNQWSSQLLNKWNGELAIDKEGNYILSAMLGAGKKNPDNTFTGVVMGDIGKLDDSTMTTTGLYGLQEGVQTFGFKTDGTGFIGRNDGGRIEFDGTQSVIKSSSWDTDNRGTYLNLDDAELQLKHSENSYLSFDENGLQIKINGSQLAFGGTTAEGLQNQVSNLEQRVSCYGKGWKVTSITAFNRFVVSASGNNVSDSVSTTMTELKKGNVVQVTFESAQVSTDKAQLSIVLNGQYKRYNIKDTVSWNKNETLAFVCIDDIEQSNDNNGDKVSGIVQLTTLSQSYVQQTATQITAQVTNIGGYTGEIYKYVVSTSTWYSYCFKFSNTAWPSNAILRPGMVFALPITKIDENHPSYPYDSKDLYLSLARADDLNDDGSLITGKQFFANYPLKADTGGAVECKFGDTMYVMYMVDKNNQGYFRQTNQVSSSQMKMLSDMISARVTNESTGEGFGWNLNANGFYLYNIVSQGVNENNTAETAEQREIVFACGKNPESPQTNIVTIHATDFILDSEYVQLSGGGAHFQTQDYKVIENVSTETSQPLYYYRKATGNWDGTRIYIHSATKKQVGYVVTSPKDRNKTTVNFYVECDKDGNLKTTSNNAYGNKCYIIRNLDKTQLKPANTIAASNLTADNPIYYISYYWDSENSMTFEYPKVVYEYKVQATQNSTQIYGALIDLNEKVIVLGNGPDWIKITPSGIVTSND